MIESYYKEDMSPEELDDLMANVLTSGLDRDVLGGWGGIYYIIEQDKITVKKIKTKIV